MRPTPAYTPPQSASTSPTTPAAPLPELAGRVDRIEPFYVMELAKQAAELSALGHDVIAMNIGEPDFTAPAPVTAALAEAVRAGKTQYAPATGLSALREALAGWYGDSQGLNIDPRRIVITAGASAGLMLACSALVNPGDGVLMPDPCYPCNRHFVTAFHGQAQMVACGPEQRFQLSALDVRQRWRANTRGVLLASPSNPTGTSIAPSVLRAILAEVQARRGFAMVDEIYQGLVYDTLEPDAGRARSALAFSDQVVSINSFSKYFGMTGWRLGWLVVPDAWVPAFEKLAQNFYICASTLAQHAALACFQQDAIAIFEARKAEFQARRDLIVPALNRLGLTVPVTPDGAFYAYCDVRQHLNPSRPDSNALAQHLLTRAHVAATPGQDFALSHPEHYLRFSFATARERIEQALVRMARAL